MFTVKRLSLQEGTLALGRVTDLITTAARWEMRSHADRSSRAMKFSLNHTLSLLVSAMGSSNCVQKFIFSTLYLPPYGSAEPPITHFPNMKKKEDHILIYYRDIVH